VHAVRYVPRCPAKARMLFCCGLLSACGKLNTDTDTEVAHYGSMRPTDYFVENSESCNMNF